jgi:hypothetical protein
MKKWTVV